MATVQRPGERYVEFDEYIDFQLDKARNGIKWTDILAAAAGVAALLIGYLVLFVAADQWAFAGGVPQQARVGLLFVVLGVAIGWFARKVVLPYLKRVNDLYAARMLESAEPELRGSLVGLVDARRGGRPPADEVRRALEKRAATTLAEVDIDAAVDRRPLMRTAYALLAVVLVACAYAVLSPKRVGPSILRALVPTSARGVATRTEILDVKPGDAAVLAGATLDVSVMIRGETPDRVMLYYSTADRRFADEPVEMRLNDETTREYRAALVGDAGRGLSQDLSYRLTANDDSAGPFSVTVEQPPVATVTKLEFQYPAYTGLEAAIRDVPPIDAIEGTNVALTAKANRRLKSAKLAFADDERFVVRGEEIPMRVGKDGVTLTASWKLAVRPDGTSPAFYRVECRDAAGKANLNPAVYPVSIQKDKPPEVLLHDPKSDLERPANAVLPLLVTARDPDFHLRELTLRLEKNGQELPERQMLWEGSRPDAAVRYDWKLAPYGLKPGDVLTYYVQARDNREPEFNRRNTPKLNITIAAPATPEQVEKQLADDRQRQEQELAEANARDTAPDRPNQEDGPSEELNPQQPKAPPDQPRENDQVADAGDRQRENDRARDDGSDRDERSAPVKNDGTDDDVVLRELIERERRRRQEEQEQKKNETRKDEQSPSSQDGDERQGGKQGEQGERREGGKGGAGKNGDKEQGSEQKAQGKQPPSDDPKSRGNDGESVQGGKVKENGTDESSESRTGNKSGPEARGKNETPEQGGTKRPLGQKGPGSAQKNDAGGEHNTKPDAKPSEGGGNSGGDKGETQNGTRKESDPSKNDSGEPESDGDAGPNAQTEEGGPDKPSEKSEGTREGGRRGTEPRMPNAGDNPQKSREGEGEAPSNAVKGEGNGNKPKPSEGDPNKRTTAADDQKSKAGSGSPRKEDQASGAAEKNTGEGRPDQQSRNPKKDENGAGRQNPEASRAPGQGEKKPGDQKASGTPTGRPEESPEGRPQQGNDPSKTDNSPKKGELEQGGPKSSDPSTGDKGSQNQPVRQDASEGQKGPRDQTSSADKPGKGDQEQSASNQRGEKQPGGQGKSSDGTAQQSGGKKDQAAKGESGKGVSGEKGEGGAGGDKATGERQDGPMSSGEAGGPPQNGDKGDSPAGQGQKGGEEGGDQAGGEDGGKSGGEGAGKSGSKPGQGGAPTGMPSSGEGGGQSGSKGGQGGGTAPGGGEQADGEAPGKGEGGNQSGNSGGAADPANPEYAKKATDLVLKKLENDLRRGEVDEKLLEELGWTKEDMNKFAERLRKNLAQPTGDETPQDAARRKEFEKMLESLSAEKAPAARAARSDRVKDVRGVGTKSPGVPSEYRDAWESFTRSVAGRGAKPSGK